MTRSTPGAGPTVLKLGGDLLRPGPALADLAKAVAGLAASGPLLIVHGAGREIDEECARRGIIPRTTDGLRHTDQATLDAVVAALSAVNVRLVAALADAGVRAVGLTGVDARLGLSERTVHVTRSGEAVDLGFVGTPAPGHRPDLALELAGTGYLPVIACLGIDEAGQVLNVNADTLAAHLALAAGAAQLIVAGGTAGVLDADGRTIADVDRALAGQLLADGRASAGMIAKLTASVSAADGGVPDVSIVDGRRLSSDSFSGTRVHGTPRSAAAREGLPCPTRA